MHITLLGTSAAEGWPGLFCDCEACHQARALGGKNLRTRSSALIDGTLKLDLPPDTLHQVLRHNLNLRCLSALLFTHAHDDHCSPKELQYLGPHFITRPLVAPLPIYGSSSVIRLLENELKPNELPITLNALVPWQVTRVGGYEVTPILARHDDSQICFNHIIRDEDGTTLLYATDTGWYRYETWEFLTNFVFDGIVIEATKGMEEGGYEGHLAIPDVVRLCQMLRDGGNLRPDAPVVATHFSHWGGLMHHELEATLAPHGITPAYDGYSFTIAPPHR